MAGESAAEVGKSTINSEVTIPNPTTNNPDRGGAFRKAIARAYRSVIKGGESGKLTLGKLPEGRQYSPKSVRLEDGRLGHELKTPGDSFELKWMFDRDADQLGSGKYTDAYFRTDSGNIYRLNDFGRLVNVGESKRTGKVNVTELKPDDLIGQDLIIGRPFTYGQAGRTTNITEIVSSSQRIYSGDYLKDLPENPILRDYQAGLKGLEPSKSLSVKESY